MTFHYLFELATDVLEQVHDHAVWLTSNKIDCETEFHTGTITYSFARVEDAIHFKLRFNHVI